MPFAILKQYLIGAGVALALIVGAYFYGSYSGAAACKAEYLKNQNDLLEKVRKSNDKIDRSTPFNSNKPTAIDWLLTHTRAD